VVDAAGVAGAGGGVAAAADDGVKNVLAVDEGSDEGTAVETA
jgi:hypothetical protein